MSGNNGHSGCDNGAVVAAAGPVMLVRYRPGVTGQSARSVHVIRLPADGQAGAVRALCGAVLISEDMEAVTAGEGMPCTLCVLNHVTSTQPGVEADASNPGNADATSPTDGVSYQAWGWPVTCHRNQVWLSLEPDTVALVIPTLLTVQVSAILVARRCSPAVLVHPEVPEHQIVLAGERSEMTLPWPAQVRRATRALPLPPTLTPRGPVTWVHPPQPDALRLCREVDVFAAVRTALREWRPGKPPAGGGPLL